jgi:hypothetical protein
LKISYIQHTPFQKVSQAETKMKSPEPAGNGFQRIRSGSLSWRKNKCGRLCKAASKAMPDARKETSAGAAAKALLPIRMGW